MFVQVDIAGAPLAGGAPVLAVPAAAVLTVDGRTSVFVPVAGEAGAFLPRAVAVGDAAVGMVPILSGLVEGEQVVVAGAFILKAELGKGGAGHGH
jgi:cobalt-zinc-cadmium efflux system membrane fusion protein